MRVGQNPVKSLEKVAPPAPVTVVVINYIPFLAGYYAHSLEVIEFCLDSLQANTEGEYDLMVFDNGSCAEVRRALQARQAAGEIQYLFLSERNLGKSAAWNIAFAAAPGETIAYADSDVLFYPGWLPALQGALAAFPRVGMVSGLPFLTPEKYSTATVAWAGKARGVKLERGSLLPWEDFWRHARSLGDTEEEARRFYESNPAVRISKKGSSYYVGSAHFQFVAPKSVLMQALPLPAERPMGRVRLLDEKIDQLGYLRLSTPDWYVQHLGNTLPAPGDLVGEAPSTPTRPARRPAGWGRWKPLRKLLQWLYDRIFTILYRN